MTLAEHARMLIAYNAWANMKVLDAAEQISDAQFTEEAGASKGSIAGNLRHIVTAQAVWLSRWTGETPPPYDLRSRAGMRAAFKDSHQRLAGYASTLTDADWGRALEYRDSSGVEQSAQLGVLIVHVVNHGTLHRGEAGMLLAAQGQSPGDLDFVFWARDEWA